MPFGRLVKSQVYQLGVRHRTQAARGFATPEGFPATGCCFPCDLPTEYSVTGEEPVMFKAAITRRDLFDSVAFGGMLFAFVPGLARAASETAQFSYEVSRSDSAWRERLGPEGFRILRKGGTEAKHSSALVTEERDGIYRCRGCDLVHYKSLWKVPLQIGWVFFRHSLPNSVLTAVDGPPFDDDGNDIRILAAIEVHCRRCGSHLGHIVQAEGQLVHCINGASLAFEPTPA